MISFSTAAADIAVAAADAAPTGLVVVVAWPASVVACVVASFVVGTAQFVEAASLAGKAGSARPCRPSSHWVPAGYSS